jgi:RNase P/RNase MRP subunit POP5
MKKVRNRYIAFEIESNRIIGKAEFIKMLAQHFPEPKRPWLIYLNNNKGIVRCAHTNKEYTISNILNVTAIANVAVKIRTIGTSGTIKKTFKKYFKKAY